MRYVNVSICIFVEMRGGTDIWLSRDYEK